MKRNFYYFIVILGIFSMGMFFGSTVIETFNSYTASIAEASNDKNKNNKNNKNKNQNNKNKKNNNKKNDNKKKPNPPKNKPVAKQPEKPQQPIIVVQPQPQPQQPQIIENNNNLENNVENIQHVVVERPEPEEKIVYVTEQGSPVYETEEVIVTPETGTGLFSLLTLVPGSIAGYFLRRRTLVR